MWIAIEEEIEKPETLTELVPNQFVEEIGDPVKDAE